MAILWSKLENDISLYLDFGIKDNSRTKESLAKEISLLYVNSIKNGGTEQYGNKIISMQSIGLENSLRNAFQEDENIIYGPPAPLNIKGLIGVIVDWESCVVGTSVPPPGAINVISNKITSPGVVTPMNIGSATSNSNSRDFSREIVKSLRLHSKTITGMCIANVIIYGVPVPMQFPWTGIN